MEILYFVQIPIIVADILMIVFSFFEKSTRKVSDDFCDIITIDGKSILKNVPLSTKKYERNST